jgi:hypothetical protein
VINERGSALRDRYGWTVKGITINKCHIEGCRAQTSNRYCAKCWKIILLRREEMIADGSVSELEDRLVNGDKENTSVPKGLLHA